MGRILDDLAAKQTVQLGAREGHYGFIDGCSRKLIVDVWHNIRNGLL